MSAFARTSGGQVTYRFLGNGKFEITARYYRDCRGIPHNSMNLVMRCATTGTTKTLSPTRISITDITEVCPSKGIICSPKNTTISSTSPAFEEHLYKDTIDFKGSESSFSSCCLIQLGIGECCRNGAITTGSSGQDFWVYSTLDLCKAPTNSSPEFKAKGKWMVAVNQPAKWDYSAVDAVDGDSLSYAFTDPMQSWTSKTYWSSGLNTQNPFTAYYPVGYDKSKGPNPNATTPIGIYLNPVNGRIVLTPVDNSETSVMAVSVKEWRKDANGNYQQIGEIVFDHQVIVAQFASNNYPYLQGVKDYDICEGEPFELLLESKDAPFKDKTGTILNDTVKITDWYFPKGAASIRKDSSYTKQDAIRFKWTPQASDIRSTPWHLTFTMRDNACPYYAEVTEEIRIRVYKKIKVSGKVTKVKNDTYASSVYISDKSSAYFLSNSIKTIHPYDTRTFYFKSGKGLTSEKEQDTLVFLKNGTYVLNRNFFGNPTCNNTLLTDTIVVSGVPELMLTRSADSMVCKGVMTRFGAKLTGFQRPVNYTWKYKGGTRSDTLGYFDVKTLVNDTLFVGVRDAGNRTSASWVHLVVKDLPKVSAGADIKDCPGTSAVRVPVNLGKDTLEFSWYRDGAFFSSQDTLNTTLTGRFILEGKNKYNCLAFDTLERTQFGVLKAGLVSGTYCQSKATLAHKELLGSYPDPIRFSSFRWNLYKTLLKPGGQSNALFNLLADIDPTLKINYNLWIDDGKIYIPSPGMDSLILDVTATDSNQCESKARAVIRIISMPQADLAFSQYTLCGSDSIDLSAITASNVQSEWFRANKTGYTTWVSAGKVNGTKIIPGNFRQTGGTYGLLLKSTYLGCSSYDSMDVIVNPLPVPKLLVRSIYDTVRFADRSTFVTSRKWYRNNVQVGKDSVLKLLKFEVNGASFRLTLYNGDCTTDTSFTINTTGIYPVRKSDIQLIPNPARDMVRIQTGQALGSGTMELINALGVTVFRDELATDLDISGLAEGVYYLHIRQTDAHTVLPLFIKR